MGKARDNCGVGALMAAPYEFLNAKLRGRRAAVYQGERFLKLADSKTVDELAAALYPGETFAGRLGLERRIRWACVNDLASIIRYLPPDVASFYIALLRRFQVDNILVLLRLFVGGKEAAPENYVPEMPPPLDVPSGELMASADLADFISKLPQDLSKAAMKTLDLFNRTGSTAFVEMALERAYWDTVAESFQQLSAAFQAECAPPIELEMNAARITAVLRAAQYYDIAWGDVVPLLPASQPLLRTGAKLSPPDGVLRELHAEPTPGSLVARVPMLNRLGSFEHLSGLDDLLWKEIVRLANRIYVVASDGPAILVAHYYTKRNELKNLTSVIEAVHYRKKFELVR